MSDKIAPLFNDVLMHSEAIHFRNNNSKETKTLSQNSLFENNSHKMNKAIPQSKSAFSNGRGTFCMTSNPEQNYKIHCCKWNLSTNGSFDLNND